MSEVIYPDNENRLKEIMDNMYNTNHDKYGFYPRYTQQKLKILYIGRESRDLDSGTNYIEYIYTCYTGKERKISGKSVNRHAFHRRLLKISYGLINNKEWSDIPKASEIAEHFGKENGISFAITNLSKISHCGKASSAISNDFKENVINTKHYLKKEISLLKPDLIIGMNMMNWQGFSEKDICATKAYNDNANIFVTDVDGTRSLYIDSYHFSAIKKDKEIYDGLKGDYLKGKAFLSTLSDNADHGRNGL